MIARATTCTQPPGRVVPPPEESGEVRTWWVP